MFRYFASVACICHENSPSGGRYARLCFSDRRLFVGLWAIGHLLILGWLDIQLLLLQYSGCVSLFCGALHLSVHLTFLVCGSTFAFYW